MLEEKLIAGHDDGDTLSDVVKHEKLFCLTFLKRKSHFYFLMFL